MSNVYKLIILVVVVVACSVVVKLTNILWVLAFN